MPITYGEAKRILSQYAGRGGKCPTSRGVDEFVLEVLQYMLYSGEYGNLRTFTFMSQKGCITLPYELEAPLKIKIDTKIGSVWDKWFEYHPGRFIEDCVPCGEALFEEPNYFPTVYDIPECGAKVGCTGTVKEAQDAHIIVKGVDTTGRTVYTDHKGQQIVGEYLDIKEGQLNYTSVTFGQITEIVKSKTIGYVPLYWLLPERNIKGYLSDYSPTDTNPQFRRFRLTSKYCNKPVLVKILGRIRLKEYYSDNDLIPFDNRYALSVAGQAVNANYNDNPQMAQAKDASLQDLIARENEHKRVQNGQPIEVFFQTSSGAIKNIIG